MGIYLSVPLLLFLITIAYQDFRSREISTYILILSVLLAILNSCYVNGYKQAIIFAGYNLALVLIQFVGVFTFFRIKNKGKIDFFNSYLGKGDVLFYVTLIFCFSPANFLVFNIFTCLGILITFAVIKLFMEYDNNVPFAGCLSLSVVVIFLLSKFINLNLFDDSSVLILFFQQIILI